MIEDEELLPIFLQEANEQLETLDHGLVRLEKEPENIELIQEIFRAAHTLKGSSGGMGLCELAEVTHHLEDVLDAIRNRQLTVTSTVIDAVLKGLDLLHATIAAIEKGGSGAIPGEEKQAVATILTATMSAQSTEQQVPADDCNKPIANLPESQFALLVNFKTDCQLPGIRAYMILKALEQYGRLVRCAPTREEIDRQQIQHRLLLILESMNTPDELREAINRVGEIEWVRAARGSAANGMSLNMPSREELRGEQVEVRAEDIGRAAPGAQQTIRVNVATLDHIMNIVGEMVLDRTRIAGLAEELRNHALDHEVIQELDTVSLHLGTIVSELHESLLETRMLPLSQLFNRFPRLVRDLAHKLGKEVNFITEGESEQLDRSIIEKLVDPLTHLLRNAIDHGMELPAARIARQKPSQGTILLSARRAESSVYIEIQDDGPGIEVERVKAKALQSRFFSPEQINMMSRQEALGLIFASGLSTAEQVSDVSGRGVGMDVVKRNVEGIGGSIEVESEPGEGTKIVLKIPLTLAILRALLVRVGQVIMAIPLGFIEETIRVHDEQIHTVRGEGLIKWREQVVPVIRLADIYRGCRSIEDKVNYLVTIRYNNKPMCLVVDSIVGHQEIVVKPLGTYLGTIPGLAGATILGNGRVALIIDVGNLFAQHIEEETASWNSEAVPI